MYVRQKDSFVNAVIAGDNGNETTSETTRTNSACAAACFAAADAAFAAATALRPIAPQGLPTESVAVSTEFTSCG